MAIRLKLRSQRQGAHIHMAVFVSDSDDGYALAGILLMHEAEYQAFRNTLAQGADVQKLLQFEEECDLSGEGVKL